MLFVIACLVLSLGLFALVALADKHRPDRLSRRGRHLAGLPEDAFAPGELFARLRAALRRGRKEVGTEPPREPLRLGELLIDFEARQVRLRGRGVHITPTEHKLLSVLAKSLGRVVTHEHLLREVWGPSSSEQVQCLRVFMMQLRKKIEPKPATPRYLLTEPAIGYRLCLPE